MLFNFETNLDIRSLEKTLSEELLKEDYQPKDRTNEIIQFIIKSSKKQLDIKYTLDNAKARVEELLIESPNTHIWIEELKKTDILKLHMFENLQWKESNEIQNENVDIEEEIDFSIEHKNILNKFLTYCYENLEIGEQPSIKLLSKRTDEMTGGAYDPQNNIIYVLAGNRAFADILRSLAHEIVHHQQKLNDKLQGDIPYVGGEIEDEANAVAGQLVKSFTKDNPKVYDI